MCGIAGIVDFHGAPVDEETLVRMTRVLQHRGPDGEGFYRQPGIGLGHRRLAVIDLSDAAQQPMGNEDGTVWITFNGEIYNYRELRADLERRGHHFKSRTDTEVVVHLYEEEGLECVTRLRGMFAFGLWDHTAGRLLLARDRIGQKPLVYTVADGKLLFASEVKSLLQAREVEGILDPSSLALFLAYGFCPWPSTMFKGIWKLPPASRLVVERGQISVEQYWRVRFEPLNQRSLEENARDLRARLQATIKEQMISDVPMGALLSGGLDSGATATLMAHASAKPLATFSVGFKDRMANDPDIACAKLLARTLGADHREIVLDDSMIDHLPTMLWHYDEPYANPVALAHFALCAAMKPSLTVVHAGDGGDELFGGYSGYARWRLIEQASRALQAIPWARGVLGAATARLRQGHERVDPLRAFLHLATLPAAERRGAKKALDARPLQSICTPAFRSGLNHQIPQVLNACYRQFGPGDFLSKLLIMDLLVHTSHSVTMCSDISGMAHGVEIRSIFLDHTVVEFAASLPVAQKVPWFGSRKLVLRRAMRELLPNEILRRPKMGYGERMPFRQLLRGGWRHRAADMLFGGRLLETGVLDGEAIHRVWERYLGGTMDDFDLVWRLMCFGAWNDAHEHMTRTREPVTMPVSLVRR